MRYYSRYAENGTLEAIGIGAGGTEITQEQYETLLAKITEKNGLIDKLYRGEITQADVPEDWRAEIVAAVEARIEDQGAYYDEVDHALAILRGEASE